MLSRRIVRYGDEDARDLVRRKMTTKAFFKSRNQRKMVRSCVGSRRLLVTRHQRVAARRGEHQERHLGILALIQHALHVTVGIKRGSLGAFFDGIEAVHAWWCNAGDVVIALLYFLLLLRGHLLRRCRSERVIIALWRRGLFAITGRQNTRRPSWRLAIIASVYGVT
jgi:hypothetical protein